MTDHNSILFAWTSSHWSKRSFLSILVSPEWSLAGQAVPIRVRNQTPRARRSLKTRRAVGWRRMPGRGRGWKVLTRPSTVCAKWCRSGARTRSCPSTRPCRWPSATSWPWIASWRTIADTAPPTGSGWTCSLSPCSRRSTHVATWRTALLVKMRPHTRRFPATLRALESHRKKGQILLFSLRLYDGGSCWLRLSGLNVDREAVWDLTLSGLNVDRGAVWDLTLSFDAKVPNDSVPGRIVYNQVSWRNLSFCCNKQKNHTQLLILMTVLIWKDKQWCVVDKQIVYKSVNFNWTLFLLCIKCSK